MKLAIPLTGKMSARSFHFQPFQDALGAVGVEPVFFIIPAYYQLVDRSSTRYAPLHTEEYEAFLESHHVFRHLTNLRRYLTGTETVDLRLRETLLEVLASERPVSHAWGQALLVDALRRVPALGRALAWAEGTFWPTDVHTRDLRERDIGALLTPGTGTHGFTALGLMAREGRRAGLPVCAAITNYDNIVNRGYPGFQADALAVWSPAMAEDAVRLHDVPASLIEVTGPVLFDRYFRPLKNDRSTFLTRRGLDPARPTVLFAGGVNITRYFEMYELLIESWKDQRRPYNVIFRPYPHEKLMVSPGWRVLEGILRRAEGVLISSALTESADTLHAADLVEGAPVEGDDELHALMRYCDVMINVFSTISLEAALCDLPTIHLAFDEYSYGHAYPMLSVYLQRQTHNRRQARLAAATLTRSAAEVRRAIDACLSDRTRGRDERRAYALYECGHLDGQASVRLARMVKERTLR